MKNTIRPIAGQSGHPNVRKQIDLGHPIASGQTHPASPGLTPVTADAIAEDMIDPTDFDQGPWNLAMVKGSQPAMLLAATSPESVPSMFNPSEQPVTQIGPHPKAIWGQGKIGPRSVLPPEIQHDSPDVQTEEQTGAHSKFLNQPLTPNNLAPVYGVKF